MTEGKKPRLVGINHVAIEVGDIDEALAWYGQIFDLTLRNRHERSAFIDMGDQFINMTRVPDYRKGRQGHAKDAKALFGRVAPYIHNETVRQRDCRRHAILTVSLSHCGILLALRANQAAFATFA